jgi:rhodanese-related sulfurtransferase
MIKELSPADFVARRAAGTTMTLLDVREPWEVELAPVPAEVVHIPMGLIADRLGELDPRRPTVVICRSGGRSMQVAHFLAAEGFDDVANLEGGILQWSRDLDPTIPQY